jgi:hypothetical protein
MKADEGAGCAFIDAVVYEFLSDQADAVRKDLVGLYAIYGLDNIQSAKRELGRSYVSKMVEGEYPDESYLQVAQWLGGLESYITKAFGLESFFNPRTNQEYKREVNRDARGRFARGIKAGSVPPGALLGGRGNSPRVKAETENLGRDDLIVNGTPTPTGERLGRMQSQYEQANQIVGEYKTALKGVDEKSVDVELTYMRFDEEAGEFAGDPFTRTFRLADLDKGKIPDQAAPRNGEQMISVAIAPSRGADPKTVQAVGAYNTLGETGGAAMASLMSMDPERLNNLKGSLQMGSDPNSSKLGRFFGQLKSGGDVLSQVTGQEKLGNAVAFVGALGPQAEEVLGPYVQRTAYRYRGTETSPDRQVIGAFRSPDMAAVDGLANTPDKMADAGRGDSLSARPFGDRSGSGNKGQGSLPLTAARNAVERGLSGDSLRMQVRADVASAYLVDKLPKDPILARLSEASGQILPSQGLLVDADGKVVSQSVGFTDDHYLPFDLKNLGSLRGGQYARTRMSGGLTGEDVYAGVTMGARQMQVVSPSGVFTLEMAPDFRGARGNSDKARSMYDRYLKILDAVENSGLYLQDISPQEKNRIETEVRELGFKGTEARYEQEKRIDEARMSQRVLTEEDEKAAYSETMAEMGLERPEQIRGAVARAFEDNYTDKIEARRAAKANKLRLNGEGYAVAMQTLQQQFPYFIRRAEFRPLNEFAADMKIQGRAPKGRGFADDAGYARPGALRAKNIKAGFYRTGSPRLENKEMPGYEARAERAAATVAPATPPAEGATTEQAPVATTAAPPPGRVALSQRLEDKKLQLEKAARKAQKDLSDELGFASAENLQVADLFYEQAVRKDPAQFTAWLISQPADKVDEVFADTTKMFIAAKALSNAKDVEQGFTKLIDMAKEGGKDFWAAGGQIGDYQTNGKPAELKDASVKWVTTKAQEMADGLLMIMGPFTVRQGNIWNGAEPNEGLPMAQPGIDQINNRAKLAEMIAKPENKPMVDLARELIVENGEYIPLSETNFRAVQRIKAFKAVKDAKPTLRNATNETVYDKMDQTAATAAAGFARVNTVTLPDAPEPGKTDLVEAYQKFNVDEEAQLLQRAWSLGITIRLVDALEAGEAIPKAEGRLMKSAGLIEVLPPTHPLSKAVARRAQEGLSFVPVRSGRALAPRRHSRSLVG